MKQSLYHYDVEQVNLNEKLLLCAFLTSLLMFLAISKNLTLTSMSIIRERKASSFKRSDIIKSLGFQQKGHIIILTIQIQVKPWVSLSSIFQAF